MMTQYELELVIEKHVLWLEEDPAGERMVLADTQIVKWADLIGRDLRRSILRRVTLRNANLMGSDLTGTDLRGADLRGADLEGATLECADLEGADLRGANLDSVRYSEETVLRNADLTGAIFVPGWKVVRIIK